MDDILYLVSYEENVDELGVPQRTETLRRVLCSVEPDGYREFYDARAAGFKAAYVFIVAKIDYANEAEVDYGGRRYSIYRHYPRSADYMELYAEDKIGARK